MPPRNPDGEDDPHRTNPNEERDPRTQDIVQALNQIFASFTHPQAAHGDAVYTQEALDRIITNLMEANPQSNAPPPASENAISSLPKKKLDAEMLGPELKGECTICMDELGMGDEVTVLPCKHWFHEKCVASWLRQHNTCPICRTSIAGESGNQRGGASGPTSPSEPGPSNPSPFSPPGAERRAQLRARREARLAAIRNLAGAGSYDQHPAPSRTTRRDSNSPPGDTFSSPSPRVRSPSHSSRRSANSDRARDRNSTSSGSGPFNWLRDRFGSDRRH